MEVFGCFIRTYEGIYIRISQLSSFSIVEGDEVWSVCGTFNEEIFSFAECETAKEAEILLHNFLIVNGSLC